MRTNMHMQAYALGEIKLSQGKQALIAEKRITIVAQKLLKNTQLFECYSQDILYCTYVVYLKILVFIKIFNLYILNVIVEKIFGPLLNSYCFTEKYVMTFIILAR